MQRKKGSRTHFHWGVDGFGRNMRGNDTIKQNKTPRGENALAAVLQQTNKLKQKEQGASRDS